MGRTEKNEVWRPRWFRSFAFRLNLWYAVIFTVSAASLFLVVYGLLSVAIDRSDRDDAALKLLGEWYAFRRRPAWA